MKTSRPLHSHESRCRIELLESRIAPSAIVSYTDYDGDKVRITDSSGHLTASDLTFIPVGGGPGVTLAKIDLSGNGFEGANITISVTKVPGGDGLANVGVIDAGTNDLGNVIVPGDLGVIIAGSGGSPAAVKMLKVRSMGAFGLSTQGGSGDLNSVLNGALGSLIVAGNIDGASLTIGLAGHQASLGAVTIGGSLLGEGSNSGFIDSSGDMGAVKIGHDVRGGAGSFSGVIETGGKIASLSIGGSLIGGAAADSGEITSTGQIGPILVKGNIQGSAGDDSGFIRSGNNIGKVTVAGSINGGTGGNSGGIESSDALGAVKIGQDLRGGGGNFSGFLESDGLTPSITIGGSMIGGSGNDTGAIEGSTLGAISVKHDIQGGTGNRSGGVSGDVIVSVTLSGSLVGGSGNDSGEIFSDGNIGPVMVHGNLLGGSIGGTTSDLSNTGIILADGRIASVLIGGSIITGVDNSTGGDLFMNAGVRAGFDIGSLTVKGSVIGSATPNGITHAVITAVGQQSPTATTDVAIGKIAIGGQVDLALIVAGRNTDLSPANGNAQIGPVTVGGDWIASSLGAGVRNTVDLSLLGNGHDSIIPVPTPPSIAKIASVTIGGIVEGSDASNDHFGFVSHSIGAFKSLGFSAGPTTVASNPSRIVIPTITGDVAIEAV